LHLNERNQDQDTQKYSQYNGNKQTTINQLKDKEDQHQQKRQEEKMSNILIFAYESKK
jgi:hypothetical protein